MAKTTKPTKKSINKNLVMGIVAAVVVIALGIGSYMFLQDRADKQNSNTGNTDSPSAPSTEEPVDKEPGEEPADGRYLVLEDWGVRFTIPEGLEGIKYYYNNKYDSYGFTTERVERLGGNCKEPVEDSWLGVIRLAGVNRSTEPRPDDSYMAPYPLNGNQPINSYYYSYTLAQSTCAQTDSEGLQQIDRQLFGDMVKSIEPR